MKQSLIIIITICCIHTVACNNKNKKASEGSKNSRFIGWEALYNTNQVFNNYKRLYDSLGFTITLIHKENMITKDSVQQDLKKIDWTFWDNEFQKINLYSEKFDKKYEMRQFALADEGTLTTNINASNRELTVRKMMINTQLANNELIMLFAEYNDKGIAKKLMYSPYKNIQLIEIDKSNSSKITQLDLNYSKQ